MFTFDSPRSQYSKSCKYFLNMLSMRYVWYMLSMRHIQNCILPLLLNMLSMRYIQNCTLLFCLICCLWDIFKTVLYSFAKYVVYEIYSKLYSTLLLNMLSMRYIQNCTLPLLLNMLSMKYIQNCNLLFCQICCLWNIFKTVLYSFANNHHGVSIMEWFKL